MEFEVMILTTQGKVLRRSYKDKIHLFEMQSIVGGYIELVPVDDNFFMVVNEEGYLLNLECNTLATEWMLAHNPSFNPQHVIVGDVFVIEKSNIK